MHKFLVSDLVSEIRPLLTFLKETLVEATANHVKEELVANGLFVEYGHLFIVSNLRVVACTFRCVKLFP